MVCVCGWEDSLWVLFLSTTWFPGIELRASGMAASARPPALSNLANLLPTSAQSTSTVDASVVISFTFWVLRYSQLECLLCSRWRLNCNSKRQASRKQSSLGSCWPEAWFSLAHICSLKQCENVQVKTYLCFNEADSGGLKISQTVVIKARLQWLVKWLSVLWN